MKSIEVNGKRFAVLKLLGKGKSGYSYCVSDGERRFVVKQIHHEPCDYYQFGDKLQSELDAWQRLRALGIPMPALLDADAVHERILKEYIEGETIRDLVLRDAMRREYFDQIREMCSVLYAARLNIDYFPTNFVVCGGKLYYVDYECNEYAEKWDFEHWGAQYWSKTDAFLASVQASENRQISEIGD